jgi:hypothetical protein
MEKKINVLEWINNKTLDLNYDGFTLNQIIDDLLKRKLYIMIFEQKNQIFVYVDNKRFTQR